MIKWENINDDWEDDNDYMACILNDVKESHALQVPMAVGY